MNLGRLFVGGGVVLLLTASLLYGAKVPAGVALADKQVLVRGNGAEPATLDPNKSQGVPASNVLRDLFEGLMTEDAEGNVMLGQAESYTVSSDKRVYTFKIKDSAVWSNGDKVTAHDFEFSWKRVADPKTGSPYSWYMDILGIENGSDIIAGKKSVDTFGVKALDDKTFQVTLAKPIPYFVIGIAHTTAFAIPKKVVEKHGDDWTKPENMVTNGAYKLKEWVVNEKIVLDRNKRYWNDKETVINEVTFVPIPQQSVELNRYRAGEIDFTSEIPNDQFKKLIQEIPNEVKVLARLGTYYYYMNMRKKPFDDVRVRKALSYAVDRDVITKFVTGTGEKPAYTFTPDNIAGYTPVTPEYATYTQAKRNQIAKRLLNEAGINKNNPLKFELLYNTSESHKRIALAIASMWKKTFDGAVTVTLKNQEWKTYLEDKKGGKFEVSRAGWIGDYNEASTMLDLMTIGHSSNNSDYRNKRYDALMDEARGVTDDAKRNKLYQKADAMVSEDMPVIPIYQYVSKKLVKPYVGGFPKVNPLGSFYTREFYIKK